MTSETAKLKRGDLRDALVVYALKASDDGVIETMSLRQAARDLGVSSGAVYRHFEDKDTLLVEIVHLGFIELLDKFAEIRPKESAPKNLQQVVGQSEEMLATYLNFALRKPALWHMMFGRVGVLWRERRLLTDHDLMSYTPFDVCYENLRDYFRLGALDVEPSFADVRYVWSAVHGAADLAQSGVRLDADQIETMVHDTCMRNLRAVGLDISQIPH